MALVGQWRYHDAPSRRWTSSSSARPGSLGPGIAEQDLRHRPPRRGADFDDSPGPPLAPADTMRRLANGRVLQLVPNQGHAPRPDRRLRSHRVHGRVRGRGRRLRRGLGQRPLPLALGDGGGRWWRASTRPTGCAHRTRGRASSSARRVRHQRPDLRSTAPTTSGSHRDPRLLRGRASRCGPVTRRSSACPAASSSPRAGLDPRRRAAVHLPNTNSDLPVDPELERHASSARRAATPAPTSAATTSPARTAHLRPAGRLVITSTATAASSG